MKVIFIYIESIDYMVAFEASPESLLIKDSSHLKQIELNDIDFENSVIVFHMLSELDRGIRYELQKTSKKVKEWILQGNRTLYVNGDYGALQIYDRTNLNLFPSSTINGNKLKIENIINAKIVQSTLDIKADYNLLSDEVINYLKVLK